VTWRGAPQGNPSPRRLFNFLLASAVAGHTKAPDDLAATCGIERRIASERRKSFTGTRSSASTWRR
jgi:hypothetical protein